MPYCPKCGTQVREKMAFCPKCGATLKIEQPPTEAVSAPAPYRAEKTEKHEKHEKEEKREKEEKTEKHEKQEFGVIGPLIGGLILIVVGFLFYLQVTGFLGRQVASAFFLIIVGVIIIVGALYATMMAARKHPST
jgi:cation transport ATPase